MVGTFNQKRISDCHTAREGPHEQRDIVRTWWGDGEEKQLQGSSEPNYPQGDDSQYRRAEFSPANSYRWLYVIPIQAGRGKLRDAVVLASLIL